MKKVKQFSYLSVIIFVVGSTIGAGIFFKNRELLRMAHGELAFVLSAWFVSLIGIIAMGLAIVELFSAQKTNKGTLEWTLLFSPKWFHKASLNYQKWFFIPVSLFTMTIYVTSSFVDVGVSLKNGWLVLLFAFLIFLFFMVINLISIKIGEVAQWITTIVKVVPLFVLPVIAFVFADLELGNTFLQKQIKPEVGITGMSKWLIIIAGLPAITFAYDNFYAISNIKEELSPKAEKKIGMAIVIGLAIITVIYMLITVAFNYGSNDGTINTISFLEKPENARLFAFFNSCIAIGILGIINSLALSSPYQLRGLYEQGEANEFRFLHKFIYKIILKQEVDVKNRKQTLFVSWIYLFLSSTLFFIVFGLIAILAYRIDTWDLGQYGTGTYLYSFVDVLTNYSSFLLFSIITVTILGALINRKTKKIKTAKKKYFIPTAIVTIVFFFSTFAYIFVVSVANIFILEGKDQQSSIIKLVILLIILLVSIIPALISVRKESKLNKNNLKENYISTKN
ncbi:AMINO ACID PERMEASE [Mycoplasmopsis pulmonis]|uniref:AMINO ACID PERMEASE n=1 Tax=Mycoplasmopsis pulmonis (strain UAB CTIP) TaxID=272635 RepID=Q98PQ8_MYCPU|nr:APC family permease [Mycoplasmopsis pulmonis]CAC13834.1 AMINO ACID PERMEASE [Mycoplasmopsis pulmonis]